ncbi:MAG: phytanoyl-CoA dioxygenase family protein, partial [Pseudomonadota bacterium]
MTLTAEQIQHYRDHGFLLLERAIPEHTLAKVRSVIAHFIESSRDVTHSNEIYDLDKKHTAERPCIRRLKDPVQRSAVFSDLARDNAIVDPVAELLGGTVRFDHSKLNFKYPGASAEIQWHQDWAFYTYT